MVNAMLDEDDSQTKNSPIPRGSVCMDVAGSMGVTRKKYPLVFMDSMSMNTNSVLVRRAKKSQCLQCDYNVRASLQCFTCVKGTMSRQWNKFLDPWRSTEWMRIYSPLYTPQANGVVKQTIGLVKNQIGKNAE